MKQFDEKPIQRSTEAGSLGMLDSWESICNNVLDENCLWRERRVKGAVQTPWMTSSVLKQLHLWDNCLKTAWRSNNADDWYNYRAIRNKAVAMIRSAKRKFFYNDRAGAILTLLISGKLLWMTKSWWHNILRLLFQYSRQVKIYITASSIRPLKAARLCQIQKKSWYTWCHSVHH